MDIGTSEESPGNTQTMCTYPYNATLQGTIPPGFFRSISFAKGIGITGQPYVQLTGCVVPQMVDRLNPADSGGQYDSNGGVTLQGNPIGSGCLGYASYVQLIEPAGPRACIRCCIDPVDCNVTLDTSGCPTVIPGNYFDCAY
ncbi:hypothetical protein FRB90_009765 [Tulasnella sp. 427]|nr:hypothetical protein FRB90_009765 [Tulasnella sp. 427]